MYIICKYFYPLDMGRHKFVCCNLCKKNFRSDNFQRHLLQHQGKSKYPTKKCQICQKIMIAWNLPRHIKSHNQSTKQILETIKADQFCYEEIGNAGQILEDLLEKEEIDPKSLRKEYVKALEVNSIRKQDGYDLLRVWQVKLLELLKPSQRDIIWVIGTKGAEGKSWFQEYIEQHFGCKRVFRTTINKNSDSILYCLSKRMISLINIFVFNVPKSFHVNDVPYTLLEEIKDGQAISANYDNKVLNFKKPNILIVFSNTQPILTRVSKDRWKIYDITKDELCVRNCMYV